MYQQNKNKEATEFVIPGYHSLDAGPFAFAKRSFGKLDLAFGSRYDIRTMQVDPLYTKVDPSSGFLAQAAYDPNDSTVQKQFNYYKHTFSGMSGSIGATYNFNEKVGLKMNVARGYRSPNIAEISAKGVHPGTGFEQLGDANFKPEFSLQEDLGLFFNSTHVSGSAEIFNNVISNYIYNEKLQSGSGGDSIYVQNGNPYPVFKFRQTTAQLYGGEISLDIHPHPLDWLHFENAASFLYGLNLGGNGASINDSTKYLPYIPPFHTNSELRADIQKRHLCFSDIYFKVGFQYYAEQDRFYKANRTETRTPAYFLLDAAVGANVITKTGRTLFIINVAATNLTDQAYQSNMSRLKYFDNYPMNGTGRSGIYSMGRNISFKITIPISVNVKGTTK
jgi:iron complex outermembrane receptor protein